MKIKRFQSYLTEDVKQDLISKLSDEDKDIKSNLIELIHKSVNSEDEKVISEFIDSFIANPDDTKIEGLINNSDIQDFYKKFSTTIDEILSNIKFYEKKPSEIDCFSLYDYIVKGTISAVKSIMEDIKTDLSKGLDEQTTDLE